MKLIVAIAICFNLVRADSANEGSKVDRAALNAVFENVQQGMNNDANAKSDGSTDQMAKVRGDAMIMRPDYYQPPPPIDPSKQFSFQKHSITARKASVFEDKVKFSRTATSTVRSIKSTSK